MITRWQSCHFKSLIASINCLWPIDRKDTIIICGLDEGETGIGNEIVLAKTCYDAGIYFNVPKGIKHHQTSIIMFKGR